MDTLRFDNLARDLSKHTGSPRRRLILLAGGLTGGLVLGSIAMVETADGRCRKKQHKCHGKCCPSRGPVCCKNYCCKKGYRCCGNKTCCKR
jgi:hypothetical protein